MTIQKPDSISLLEKGLHLVLNGENAPGGNETWSQWVRDTELFLRGWLEGHDNPTE